MAAKLVNSNLNTVFAKSLYQYLKSTINDDTFYVSVAYIPPAEYLSYAGADSDNTEFKGGALAEDFDSQDSQFYSQNIMSLHKVFTGGVSRVVERADWTTGNTYAAWNETARSHVLVKEFVSGTAKLNVYQCLFSPRTPSIYSPSGTSVSPIYLSDGYVWKYLYTISNSEAIRFLNADWMPVPERVSANEALSLSSGGARSTVYSVQQNAELGTIFDVLIDSDVFTTSLFDSELNISVVDLSSNTPGQKFEAKITKGIDDKPVLSLTEHGLGYIGPVRVVNAATDSEINGLTAILSPGLGFGSDIPFEVGADDVMITTRNAPDGDTLKVINDNPFNMINLIRNPIDSVTKLYAEKDFYVGCRSFTTTTANTYVTGDVIVTTTGKTVYVNSVSNGVVYYTNYKQGEETQYLEVGENVSLDNGTKPNTISAIYDREVNFNSGNYIMLDWKEVEFIRSNDQIETFSFVIRFE